MDANRIRVARSRRRAPLLKSVGASERLSAGYVPPLERVGPRNLMPDVGEVRLGTNLAQVTLDQRRETLDPEQSLAETLTGGSGDTVTVRESRNVVGYMKDFLFRPEQARTPSRYRASGSSFIHQARKSERAIVYFCMGIATSYDKNRPKFPRRNPFGSGRHLA
jgi:hypothetical protein